MKTRIYVAPAVKGMNLRNMNIGDPIAPFGELLKNVKKDRDRD